MKIPGLKNDQASCKTLSVPDVGTQSPATLTMATDVPFRVVVRNVGGNTVYLAYDVNALTLDALQNVYELPVDRSETFLVMPGQGLYVAGAGTNGRIALAQSPAFPVGLHVNA